MSLIRLDNVYKIYNEGRDNQVNALDGVTLEIDQGEFVAVIGTSGSGKSTMMNILGCLDVPTRGEYYLDGIPIRERRERELSAIRSRRIGFVFQGYNLIPALSVWQNVALPLTYQHVRAEERRKRAMEALERVEIADKADAKPGQLPEDSSSGWPLPVPLPPVPPSSWPTSPREPWTPKQAPRCSSLCGNSTGSRAPPSSSSPMTTPLRPRPTVPSGSWTGRSSTTACGTGC